MNEKFPVLSFISIVLKIVGWIVVIPGVYFALYQGIIEPNQPGHHFATGDFIELGMGCLLTLFGLAAAALGEIIGVLFAIELNTRS